MILQPAFAVNSLGKCFFPPPRAEGFMQGLTLLEIDIRSEAELDPAGSGGIQGIKKKSWRKTMDHS